MIDTPMPFRALSERRNSGFVRQAGFEICFFCGNSEMKVLSICHSSRARTLLPHFIIFFITFYVHKLESARFTVIGPDHPVTAIMGEDIILPCHLSPKMSAENMEVRWFRSEFTSFVHLYQHGKDEYGQQMPEYHGRTELLKAGIVDGNVALGIVNIRLSDEGQYRCFVQDGVFHEEAVLELKVAASGSAPRISVEGHQDGGIQVVCQSAGWYPEPKALWRNLKGQPLSSSTETKSEEQHGLFEIKNSIVITENSNKNLSCAIRNTHLNREKESITFYISGKHLNTISKLQTELEWRRSLGDAANVTLDPDTAHPELVLSKDRKSVRWADTWQDVPHHKNPERFDIERCVLGCEGFTSGRHYWEVEVGVGLLWAVGVARESVRRKGGISLSPEEGIWAVDQRQGQYQALTSPVTPLDLSQAPSRIRVCLDCEQGQVTFINAGDEAPIFTFPPGSVPGERIRPWLWLGMESQLKLCP
ncbi:butyrophilin subfamily 1 member A1 isoform X2 [Chelonia mydas]|uniref:butyrophilin subfamily 1 member A1 isoform X2 n=1 Tax=Chelonia mydas TaxID=8469 RepID=UPI0018A207D4|nr:butyrophilin subfamily 1 member A1 isoform X2 [Chelonia mydas]